MAREIKPDQDYKSRLLKLIPTEIIAFYLPCTIIIQSDMVPANHYLIASVIIAIIGLIFTWGVLWYSYEVRKAKQIIYVCLAFVVWVYTLGGPFKELNLYYEYIAMLLLPTFTFVSPWIYKQTEPIPNPDPNP